VHCYEVKSPSQKLGKKAKNIQCNTTLCSFLLCFLNWELRIAYFKTKELSLSLSLPLSTPSLDLTLSQSALLGYNSKHTANWHFKKQKQQQQQKNNRIS